MTNFNAEIYHSIDLTESKLNHTSISGGKASHSFLKVGELSSNTLKGLIKLIAGNYGKIYDSYENKAYIAIDEDQWHEKDCHENYEAFITKNTTKEVDLSDLIIIDVITNKALK
jgi:hypothetical protein